MTLSNGHTLTEVLSVTLLGILIVFSALVILMIVLYLMKLFAPSEEGKKAEKVKETPAPKMTEKPAVNDTDDEELIAVLTAAIAASLQTSAYNLRIKSYKRVPSKNSKRV